MNDKQKQIEDLAKCIYGKRTNTLDNCKRIAEQLIENEGYRKVVTCKDCIHRWTTGCALYQGTCEVGGDMKVFFNGACHDDDFYCKYGENKPE